MSIRPRLGGREPDHQPPLGQLVEMDAEHAEHPALERIERPNGTTPPESRGPSCFRGLPRRFHWGAVCADREQRRFGKGFRVALRPLGTPKDSPTHGPQCSEANQHPSHACGYAIDRPILPRQ